MNSIILLAFDNTNLKNNLRQLVYALKQIENKPTDVIIFILKNQTIDLINISKTVNINKIFIHTQRQGDFLNPFLIAKEYAHFIEKYNHIISCNNDFGNILLSTIASLLDYEVITNVWKISEQRFFHTLSYNSNIEDIYTNSCDKIFLLINNNYFNLMEYQEKSCEIENIYYSVNILEYQVIQNETNKQTIPYDENIIIAGDEIKDVVSLDELNQLSIKLKCIFCATKKTIENTTNNSNLEIIDDIAPKICIHIGSNQSHKELSKLKKSKIIIAILPTKFAYLYEMADFVTICDPKYVIQLLKEYF